MNGHRLRQIRKLRGLTQTSLAEMSGVTGSLVSQIESGTIQPSDEVSSAIATSLRFPEGFFSRSDGPDLPLGSLTFRARRSATKRALNEAQAWAELVLECVAVLADDFNLPAVRVPRLDHESPESAAEITRASIGISPDRPIPNVTHAMEQAGTLVIAVPVPLDHRDAFSTWMSEYPVRPLVALCTRGVSGDRLRHSLGHELGHLTLHRSPRGTIAEIEKEADRFASEFLMPAHSILDEFTRPVTIESLMALKPRWGVSVASLVYRARELGAISRRRAQSLFIEIGQRWGRSSPEPLAIPVEKPRALRKLIESMYGDPPDVRRFAREFALPLELAATVIGSHASRGEVVAVVPDASMATNLVQFPRRADGPRGAP